MNELDWLLTVVVGVIIPPFAAYLTKFGMGKGARVGISWGLALVVSVIWAWQTDKLGPNWPTVETIGVILMATQTAYDRLWKPLGAGAGGVEVHKILTYVVARLTRMPVPR